MKSAKYSEQFAEVFLRDAHSRVFDVDDEHLLDWVKTCLDRDRAVLGELECIPDQIDQHLLESSLITDQQG